MNKFDWNWISPTSARILIALFEHGKSSYLILCSYINSSFPTVNRYLKKLEEKGYIEEKRELTKKDGVYSGMPKRNIFLTNKGKEVARRLMELSISCI